MDPFLIVGAGIIGLTVGQGLKKVLVSYPDSHIISIPNKNREESLLKSTNEILTPMPAAKAGPSPCTGHLTI